MNVFLANKSMQFGVSLKEIEQMTPAQAYLLKRELTKTAKELERINVNGRN